MTAKTGTNDPYFREDPGAGFQRICVHSFDIENKFFEWKSWRTNDGRILPNAESNFSLISNPFDTGTLIQLTTTYDPAVAGKSFGGFGMRVPINPPLTLMEHTFIEFDLYYPKSAAGKYMRFEIWSTSTGGEGDRTKAGMFGANRSQYYIRTENLENIGNFTPDWMDFFNGDTWYRKLIRVPAPVSSGVWEYLNIDIHTETATKVENGLLLLGNIRITQANPDGAIPNVVNEKLFSEVPAIKDKYSPENGYFYIGTVGAGPIIPNTIRQHHFQIFTDEDDLKPENHLRPPEWLKEMYPNFNFLIEENEKNDGSEWNIPTENYVGLRDSGADYKIHGHSLACINQSPPWMRQIIPEKITSMQWNDDALFYAAGNNASGPFLKLPKEQARRLYYDHILYTLRHFMTENPRYNSSQGRGKIPFHSYDVINIEIHESRYSSIIPEKPNEWKTALKHTSWFMAMTDDDYKDIRQHYIYLLFKYAHIAVPNELMAAKYKAGYNDPSVVPRYLKLDGHDNNGSIDEYVSEKPPILVFNEYVTVNYAKMRIAYNLIKEINAAWKTDPLYDGRNLIECMGIQGHDTVSPGLVSHNKRFVAMFASLIDEGLLDCICYSEVDLKQHDEAPGGGANAPDILNEKQADSIGYQYALFFKLFEKYSRYIDHVIFWSQYGESWQSSYVIFDHEKKASQAYYGIMDPDRFIQGHSYLEEYFKGEYDKVK